MSDDNTQDGAEPSLASAGSGANHSAIPNSWIPVTERLPDRNEIVLATDQDGVTVGSYSPMLDDWWTLHGDRMAPGAVVTHWMPLPAPPSDDK
jgi:hypothetical protein